jgi:hypothetical protein
LSFVFIVKFRNLYSIRPLFENGVSPREEQVYTNFRLAASLDRKRLGQTFARRGISIRCRTPTAGDRRPYANLAG